MELGFSGQRVGHTHDSPGVAAGNCLSQFAVKLFFAYQTQLEAWLSGLLLKPGIECIKCCMLSHFSDVQLFVSPWSVACQAPLSIEFSRREYWSGLPCHPLGDLPKPGTEHTSLMSPALAGRMFTTSATWEALGRSWSKEIRQLCYKTLKGAPGSFCVVALLFQLGTIFIYTVQANSPALYQHLSLWEGRKGRKFVG